MHIASYGHNHGDEMNSRENIGNNIIVTVNAVRGVLDLPR